ncbi:MAG TPA: S24/S26 family peptidase [Kiritimatiellia bacterium]|nr:S24/S26 family peptidase [Kiritimatiellia bacterium]
MPPTQPQPTGTTLDASRIVAGLLDAHEPVTFAPRGPSMHPVLRDGDLVHIEPTGAAGVYTGAIVLVRYKGRLVLHRVVALREQGSMVELAGDAAVEDVQRVPASDVLGKVIWRQRNQVRRRLDTPWARWLGMVWHKLRPIRKPWFHVRRARPHDHPSGP